MDLRDLRGYGPDLPHARWPSDARVAVSFVVNFEEGAEYAILDGDTRNEGTYEMQDERVDVPDPCATSHFDYGTRAGWARVRDLFRDFDVRFTLSACGRAVERSPWLAAEASRQGHEVACHGWRWESHAGMGEATERAAIQRTVRVIQEATGRAPVGWHTRSSPSANTRRLLLEHGGFLYDSDAYDDDLPHFVRVDDHRHLVIPYSFDTNDMHFHQGRQRFVFGGDFARYVGDAFDWLVREGERRPRMLSVGLHLRMIGRPGRMAGLEALLSHMKASGHAWFATREQIARHWLARFQDTAP